MVYPSRIVEGGRDMAKGEGGGVSIGFGSKLPASGEPRGKLRQATELDTHLTQKADLQKRKALAQRSRKRRKKK